MRDQDILDAAIPIIELYLNEPVTLSNKHSFEWDLVEALRTYDVKDAQVHEDRIRLLFNDDSDLLTISLCGKDGKKEEETQEA